MTYFPDLSEYSYGREESGDPARRNVGWLDKSHGFPTGDVGPDRIEKLRKICAIRHRAMRGWHLCELCGSPERGVPEICGGMPVKLGSAEIRVEGKDGVVYCAPNLILHYVTAHRYMPPVEFLMALDGS